MKTINPYKMFIGSMIPNWLMERKEVSHGAKLCYARLCQYAGRDGRCHPKQKTLAQALSVSPRQAWAYLDELSNHKLIQPIRVGLGRANSYLFLDHPWMHDTDPEADCEPDSRAVATPDSQVPAKHLRESEKENHIREFSPSADSSSGSVKVKDKKPSNPNHTPLKTFFLAKFKEEFGYDYTFVPRNGRDINSILEACGNDLEKAKRLVTTYFGDTRDFVRGHPLSLLPSQINRYMAEVQRDDRSPSADHPVTRPHIRMDRYYESN